MNVQLTVCGSIYFFLVVKSLFSSLSRSKFHFCILVLKYSYTNYLHETYGSTKLYLTGYWPASGTSSLISPFPSGMWFRFALVMLLNDAVAPFLFKFILSLYLSLLLIRCFCEASSFNSCSCFSFSCNLFCFNISKCSSISSTLYRKWNSKILQFAFDFESD